MPIGGSSKLLDYDANNSDGFDVDATPSTTPYYSSSSINGKQFS